MTRKDFVLIARVLSDAREASDNPAEIRSLDSVARRFSRELAGTNPRFDGHRFLAACGVKV